MSAHSPGPWRIDPMREGCHAVISCDTWTRFATVVVRMFEANEDSDDGIANAQLIAAAPELLAALKALTSNKHLDLGDQVYAVREHEGEGWNGPSVKAWSDAVIAARAAIAKAERRS